MDMSARDAREAQRQQILDVLEREGMLARIELFERCDLIDDPKQVSIHLHALKRKGCVHHGDDGWSFVMREQMRATRPGSPRHRKAHARARHEQESTDALAENEGNGLDQIPGAWTPPGPMPRPEDVRGVMESLEDAAQSAQAAVDCYCWSVGDQQVLTLLMAQRDQARDTLEAYRRISSEDRA